MRAGPSPCSVCSSESCSRRANSLRPPARWTWESTATSTTPCSALTTLSDWRTGSARRNWSSASPRRAFSAGPSSTSPSLHGRMQSAPIGVPPTIRSAASSSCAASSRAAASPPSSASSRLGAVFVGGRAAPPQQPLQQPPLLLAPRLLELLPAVHRGADLGRAALGQRTVVLGQRLVAVDQPQVAEQRALAADRHAHARLQPEVGA